MTNLYHLKHVGAPTTWLPYPFSCNPSGLWWIFFSVAFLSSWEIIGIETSLIQFSWYVYTERQLKFTLSCFEKKINSICMFTWRNKPQRKATYISRFLGSSHLHSCSWQSWCNVAFIFTLSSHWGLLKDRGLQIKINGRKDQQREMPYTKMKMTCL